MTSEIQPSEKEEWLKHKTIVGVGLGAIVDFTRQKLKDMMPSIQIIKEKQLWRHGGYNSFKEFCEKGLSVTRQRIYQLLSDEDTRKMLEFNEPATSHLTPEPQPERPQKPEKKAKVREIKPPAVIEVESTTTPIDPDLDPTQISYTAAESAPQQIELDFTVQIIAPDDDRLWFQSLTPTERGQAIAKARSAQ